MYCGTKENFTLYHILLRVNKSKHKPWGGSTDTRGQECSAEHQVIAISGCWSFGAQTGLHSDQKNPANFW
jgi:hypothetical protein